MTETRSDNQRKTDGHSDRSGDRSRKGSEADEARTRLLGDALSGKGKARKGGEKPADESGDRSRKPGGQETDKAENTEKPDQLQALDTPAKGFNGTLTSPDKKSQHKVVNGEILDATGKKLGTLDRDGKVVVEGADFGPTAVNSTFRDYVFEGKEDGHDRSFACNQKMSSGRIFLPGEDGNNVEHEVRMGMIINKSTGEQVGIVVPPEESADGKLSGGQIITAGNPPEVIPMSAATGVVFDLKLEGQTGMEGRRVQGVALGVEKNADGTYSEKYLNIQDACEDQRKIMSRAGEKLRENEGFHPVDWLSGAQEINEGTYKQEQERAKSNIELYQNIIKNGQVNDGLIKSADSLSSAAKVELYGPRDRGADKPAEKPENKPEEIKIPDLSTAAKAAEVNGKLRVGNEIFEIKNGDLYRVRVENGQNVTDKESCGRLGPDYTMQIDGRRAKSLAHEDRVLMEFTVAGSAEKHQIIGLGERRKSDAVGYIPGGLVDVKELERQAQVVKENADKANLDYFENRPYVTGGLANWAMGDREAILKDFAGNIERQRGQLDSQAQTMFKDGFDATMSNNQLDLYVKSVQLIAHNIGATGASTEHLSRDGQQMQQMVADSATMAAITVATAGTGALISGAVTAGRIGVIAATGAEIAAGAGTGALVSTTLRASDRSDWKKNALAGAVEGGTIAFGSSGARMFGNMAELKRVQTIAADLKSGTRVAADLTKSEAALLNTAAGKMALAGAGDKTIKVANAGYKTADSVIQTTAFNGSHAIRTGDTSHMDARSIALGSAAMLLGTGVGHGLDRGVGKAASGAESTVARHIGDDAASYLLKAETSGVGRRMLNDTVNSYTNGSVAAMGDALAKERERVATELGIKKEDLSDDQFWRHAKVDNILSTMNDAGVMSAAMAPALTVGTGAILSRMKPTAGKDVPASETTHNARENNAADTSGDNGATYGPDVTLRLNDGNSIPPVRNFEAAPARPMEMPEPGTRKEVDGRNVTVKNVYPQTGEVIVMNAQGHGGKSSVVSLEPPLQVHDSQLGGWHSYSIDGATFFKNADGKFYRVMSSNGGHHLLLPDYRYESVPASRLTNPGERPVEISRPRVEGGAGDNASSVSPDRMNMPDGSVVVKTPQGKWVKIFPSGHANENVPPSQMEGEFLHGPAGEIIQRTGIVDIVTHQNGQVEVRNNPDFVQVVVPPGGKAPSSAFVDRINRAILNIPAPLRKLVSDTGTRVRLASLSTDAKPELRGVQPRGWQPGDTWSLVDGLHDSGSGEVIIAERVRVRDSYYQRFSHSPEAVAYHEFGHGIDAALGHITESPDFKAAYDRDLRANYHRMTPEQRRQFEYFVQLDPANPNTGTPAGRQELFAEMFAGLMGTSGADYNQLRSFFPTVEGVMVNSLRRHSFTPRTRQRAS